MDNYPDDIRQYDNDPRSPFYVDKEEGAREDMIENLTDSEILQAMDENEVYMDEDLPELLGKLWYADPSNDLGKKELEEIVGQLRTIADTAINKYVDDNLGQYMRDKAEEYEAAEWDRQWAIEEARMEDQQRMMEDLDYL